MESLSGKDPLLDVKDGRIDAGDISSAFSVSVDEESDLGECEVEVAEDVNVCTYIYIYT